MVPAATSTRRPGNAALYLVLAALSALGLWAMRIATAMNDVPLDFLEILETGVMPGGVLLEKRITGVKPIDDVLSLLVAAFLPGLAKWNESYYLQQFHFLIQLTPLIAVMTVEACRERNQGSWLKYTSIWALVYQTLGGAVFVNLWFLVFCSHSAEKPYFAQGRAVRYAPLIAPSIIFLFFLPTLAMFIPDLTIDTLQAVIAFWQASPIYVNIPLWLASPFSSRTSTTTKNKTADLPHLKFLYIFSFIVSVAVHWYTIYGIYNSEDPSVSIASVFIPSTYKWKNSMSDGLLWIFQCDWVIIGLGLVISSLVAICDIQRLIYDSVGIERFCEAGIAVAGLTWLGGPGAMLSAVWYWREQKLAMVEQVAGSKKEL